MKSLPLNPRPFSFLSICPNTLLSTLFTNELIPLIIIIIIIIITTIIIIIIIIIIITITTTTTTTTITTITTTTTTMVIIIIIIIIYFLPLIFTDIEQVTIYIVCMAFVIIQITSLSLKIHKKHTISV